MKQFDVTIKGYVIKTYRIEAEDEESAIEMAHEGFSMLHEEGIEENYNQETVSAEEVEG